ncbi:hypothetical protein JCGZ_02136 [Jatropha curcas]|uniref:FAF domain-containing protein n=1 Tax=Jatropha curcas TaxID=180498 RepID=A0A067KYU3_JATCU|nr:protein FANTASTIC FOUR 3 [Jatropha curcas]KDP40138.1 hypothetical protein JCGZ_02136 [Jatropha curcas]
MATVVYQGLQSCLESQLVESRTLRLRLSSPKPQFYESLELALKTCSLESNTKELSEKRHEEEKHKSDMGGWSFLQVLSDTSVSKKEPLMEKEKNTYVHPLMKRYPSTLSEKSLELCTENLGSESGTDIVDDSIFSLSSSLESEEEEAIVNCQTREQQNPHQLLGAKKANSRSFPPPLTTMSGSEFLRVRSHREDGRLIIKAVKAPLPPAYFQAERSHGRLRLSFVKDAASKFDSFGEVASASKEENRQTENDVNYDEEEEMEEEFEEEEEEEEEEEFETEEGNVSFCDGKEGVEGNHLTNVVGAEMGRPSRCKEGEVVLDNNKGLLNWETFWVATS